jgi:hypothetical protein
MWTRIKHQISNPLSRPCLPLLPPSCLQHKFILDDTTPNLSSLSHFKKNTCNCQVNLSFVLFLVNRLVPQPKGLRGRGTRQRGNP